MNVLLIGQNLKMADILSNFANIFLVVDKNADYRSWAHSDYSKYNLINSQTKLTSTLSIFTRCKEICKWVKANDIDVIFTNEKVSMVAAKLASLLVRKKLILLSTSHSSYAWQNYEKVKKFAKVIDMTTDGYVALASFVYDFLVKFNVDRRKLLLQPNVIEYDTFRQKQDYSIANKVNIVYVAAIYPQKGQLVLLEAAKILQDKGVNVNIDLFGDVLDEEFKASLERYIAANGLVGCVTFKGSVGNHVLRSILCEYDIYVSPSFMEMSPLNILEAKAAALPVIANNVGGICDLVTDGVDGLLVESNDPKRLAECISKVIKDNRLRQFLGENAFKNVVSRLSPTVAIKNIENFIKTLQ